MGDAMEEGTILRWLKREGEPVAEEEGVAEVQTEKASIEIPSSCSGVLTRILVPEGQTVPVGAPIAYIGQPGEQMPAADQPALEPARGPALILEAASSPLAPQLLPSVPPSGGRIKVSPLARKLAAEYGLDLALVEGTGPGGRIIEADIEETLRRVPAAAPPVVPAPSPAVRPPAGFTDRPLSPMRRAIARRLTESKRNIPHFYLAIEVDMRAASRVRADYNASVPEERRVSVNDLVVRACVLALERWPQVNSRLEGEAIRTPAGVHVGVAVSLPEGLIVPVVRDAQERSVSQLGQEIRRLAERARKGQLRPDEYSGGTFTVSNLGMYGITAFQAVINPPEAAILAVGALRDTPIVENGQVVPGRQMCLTLSVDHRVVDGAVAAEFLQEAKRLLETPFRLFTLS